ncbi:MAG: hypothetical protein GEU81_12660 [Nitriliruptorales bacterium]|nr:hypothetical protein [Nitriliruptorales bacterium]
MQGKSRSPMSSPATGAPDRARSLRPADVVITLMLSAVFVGAYVLAEQWPFRAAFLPQLLAILGMTFGVLKLIGFVVQLRRGHDATAGSSADDLAVGDVTLISDEEEDQSLEYVFATAGGKAWAAALGWVFAFFLMLWLFGVFVAVPVFAFVYLKLSGGAGWLGAGLYAAVAASVLYIAFARLLSVPMPEGIF